MCTTRKRDVQILGEMSTDLPKTVQLSFEHPHDLLFDQKGVRWTSDARVKLLQHVGRKVSHT